MTILLSILGIHIVNVFFIFFNIARVAAKCGMENAYNVHFLLWLFRHPLLNCITIGYIFGSNEESLTALCKKTMEKN